MSRSADRPVVLGLVGLAALAGCDAVTDPLGQERRVEGWYTAVRVAAPVGLAFSLPGGLGPDELHVMCANGPETAVRSRWERLPEGGGELILEADQPVETCVVTVSARTALDLIDDTVGPLDLTTQQALRLRSVTATSVLLHTSVLGSFLVDSLTVRDAILSARGSSTIEVETLSADLLEVRTDGNARTAVYDAEVGAWEVLALAHAVQVAAGVAEHVSVYARGEAQVQMMDVRAETAEIDVANGSSVLLGVDPADADVTARDDAEVRLGG